MTTRAVALQNQAGVCASLGAPLYAAILDAAADDQAQGGVVAAVLAATGTPEADAEASAEPLRFLAAVHRRVLTGRAPAVARHFPSRGSSAQIEGAWEAVRALLAADPDGMARDVARPCQTNDVGRAAVLLAGLLAVSARHALPIRLLEIGASAGLNLWLDQYRIGQFGPPDGPVVASDPWAGRVPTGSYALSSREGCDPAPVDPRTEAGRLALIASVWPEQVERATRLRGALAFAARQPFPVSPASALEWLSDRLSVAAAGVATVVWHSVVWQYLEVGERRDIEALLQERGAQARRNAPLVHLAMEPERRGVAPAFALRATYWPGEEHEHLADVGPHGPPVRLLAA